jgi:hypothetical protein
MTESTAARLRLLRLSTDLQRARKNLLLASPATSARQRLRLVSELAKARDALTHHDERRP